MTALSRSVFLAALVLSAACTVHGTDVPALTGPSEYGLSVSVTATPDVLSQDGASQSSIVVVVRDANGKGVAGRTVRVETAVNGAVQDYGMLSARTLVTGGDGRATAIYTAPPPPPSLGGSGTVVAFHVTPIGTDYQAASTQSAEVRLVPPGVVLPPTSAPSPSFSVSPTPVLAGIATNFDAARSCATQDACSSTAGITAFEWSFGDGTSALGQFVAHTFPGPGNYVVRLTVTNDRGLAASTTQAVDVGASTAPTAKVIVTPADAKVGVPLTFNADQSRAAAGRTITQYSWNWGDGTAGQVGGFVMQHTYTAPGTYTVVLSVLDDAGQKGTATATVTVAP